MHKHKLIITIGLAITAITALSAIAASMATATLPEFLITPNGTFPLPFTSYAGPGTLKSGFGNIVCASERDRGEITAAKTIIDTIDFERCTAFGTFRANSLGDPRETILVTVIGTLCYTNAANREVGLLILPTGKLHLEVEVAGLAVVEGSVTGALTPVNALSLEFRLLFKEKAGGGQEPEGCEDEREHLTVTKGTTTDEGTLINHTVIGLLKLTAEIMA
jgi:hypothetical protein